MSSSVTLKVTNRLPKKPIKGLPSTIEITDKTTVQDVKNLLSKACNGRDPERFGIQDPEKKKILKDKRALVVSSNEVIGAKEIIVKDLGPQLSWTTVFVIEYLGPLLIHLIFPFALRPYIYSSAPPLSPSQILSSIMIVLHFIKREYETRYVHKFSLSTMPASNIVKNCQHYWLWSGANLAYWIYAPNSYTALSSSSINAINTLGLFLYVFGELSNLSTHVTLSKLRAKGGTERGIPKGYGFDLVTCPNYFFELIAWLGITLVTKSVATVLFSALSLWQMRQWAIKKERALRAEFPEYKRKKYVLIPGIC